MTGIRLVERHARTNRDANKLQLEDRAFHGWYRFVLSYPPHLVRDYLQRFEILPGQVVLDPFCGTGTTIVECKKRGVHGIGIEANPMAAFASRVKVDWSPDPAALLAHAQGVFEDASAELLRDGIEDQPALVSTDAAPTHLKALLPAQHEMLLEGSISPLPLHKALVLLECLDRNRDDRFHAHELLALGTALVTTSSNLHFGPEVGVSAPKSDAPVLDPWFRGVREIAGDLQTPRTAALAEATVHPADARRPEQVLAPESVDCVITSPPYPNEKDYTRTTRLESVLLGLIKDRDDLRRLKQGLIRSNTRNVYKADSDDDFVSHHAGIQTIAAAIEARRLELGKTSGFEKMYSRVARLYFGGMARHLAGLRQALKPGARLAYVVGDQASYLRVMIRTGQLLAELAAELGYEVIGIDLFRTRLATATREELREEVVVLRWPGPSGAKRSSDPIGLPNASARIRERWRDITGWLPRTN